MLETIKILLTLKTFYKILYYKYSLKLIYLDVPFSLLHDLIISSAKSQINYFFYLTRQHDKRKQCPIIR